MLDGLASLTVVGSFGAPGIAIRRHRFADPELREDLSKKTVVVTGASRGIGRATAEALALRGASVVLVARDAGRLEDVASGLLARGVSEARLRVEPADLSSLRSTRALGERLTARHPAIDVLVNNAGTLERDRTITAEGLESAFVINVLSGFLLTSLLRPSFAAAGRARVVHVSSGGMYLATLARDVLEGRAEPYDGVAAYAACKRAQVLLSELWAEKLAPIGATSNAMHPGWVETDGVARSLPRFHRWMRPVLRTAEEGADTVVWLAASREAEQHTGRFFFDRAERRTSLPGRRPTSRALAIASWNRCVELTGVEERIDET